MYVLEISSILLQSVLESEEEEEVSNYGRKDEKRFNLKLCWTCPRIQNYGTSVSRKVL
jgi:hypothetical protein